MEERTPTFRQSLEGSYLRGYRTTSLVMGLYFLLLLPWRIGWMRSEAAHPLLIGLAAGLGAGCLLWAALMSWRPSLLGSIENGALGLAAAGLVNNAALLILARDPDQAANFMLVILVAGLVFLSRWRFLLVSGLSLGLWGIGTLRLIGPGPFWNWLFPMIAALALGLVVHLFAGHVLRELETLRTRDQVLLHQRQRLIGDLRQALDSVRTLRGLIPICAQCKKVRDDTGYWQQVESYLADHSEAQVTHGLCPHCAHHLMEEFEAILPEEPSEP